MVRAIQPCATASARHDAPPARSARTSKLGRVAWQQRLQQTSLAVPASAAPAAMSLLSSAILSPIDGVPFTL